MEFPACLEERRRESEANGLTERERLTQLLETELLPKIYGFCILKMNTEEEADDQIGRASCREKVYLTV